MAAACGGRLGDSADEAIGVNDPETGSNTEETDNEQRDAEDGETSDVISASGGSSNDNETPDTDHELVYQIESDSLNGWMPERVTPTVSGHLVMRTVFDSLVYPDAARQPRPLLLETLEPNDDASAWILTVRPDIQFHDGTPFDAAAVVTNLERHRNGALTAAFTSDIASIQALDDRRVEVTLDGPTPSFPIRLTSQIGYMASPTWLAAVDAGEAAAEEPVGTGPFVFEDYNPGRSFTATRNESYWRENQPLVAGVKFQITSNHASRLLAVLNGTSPIAVTTQSDQILRARELVGALNLVEAASNSETLYVMLNQADPDSPLADVNVRRALSFAVDRDRWKAARSAGFFESANGPFSPGSIGYLNDTGIPANDQPAASALIETYEAANDPIELTLLLEDIPTNLISSDLLVLMWREVGVEVTPVFLPRDELSLAVYRGEFEMALWQGHGSFDPVLQRNNWHSSGLRPVGEISANASRINDPEIDELLGLISEEPNQSARQFSAERLNRRFGEQAYNIWLSWPVWAVVHNLDVHLTGSDLPDGDRSLPLGGAVGGAHLMSHVWVEQR